MEPEESLRFRMCVAFLQTKRTALRLLSCLKSNCSAITRRRSSSFVATYAGVIWVQFPRICEFVFNFHFTLQASNTGLFIWPDNRFVIHGSNLTKFVFLTKC